MAPRPARPTLFPYTTLFRSQAGQEHVQIALEDLVDLAVAEVAEHTAENPVRLAVCSSSLDALERQRHRLQRETHRASWSRRQRSEEHTSELQSHVNLVCRLL